MIDPFWQQCLTHLHGELSQGQFNNWIKPLNVALEDGQILLLAPNSFVLQWVRDRFLKRFEDLAEGYFGRPMRFGRWTRPSAIRSSAAATSIF